MLFADAIRRLREALAGPLPGTEAQLTMAPRPRPPSWRPDYFPEDARRAAVLLMLYPVDEQAHLILTLRTDAMSHHRGQVSLPGGALAPGETVERAALREAQEEVGLPFEPLVVLGTLTPIYVRVSGYVLHPVVASAERRPVLRAESREVARILEVPLSTLIDPARQKCERHQLDGRDVYVPFFEVHGQHVWGATAMALSELLALLGYPAEPTLIRDS